MPMSENIKGATILTSKVREGLNNFTSSGIQDVQPAEFTQQVNELVIIWHYCLQLARQFLERGGWGEEHNYMYLQQDALGGYTCASSCESF